MVRQWLSMTLSFLGAAPFEPLDRSLWSPAHCLLFRFHYHLPQWGPKTLGRIFCAKENQRHSPVGNYLENLHQRNGMIHHLLLNGWRCGFHQKGVGLRSPSGLLGTWAVKTKSKLIYSTGETIYLLLQESKHFMFKEDNTLMFFHL